MKMLGKIRNIIFGTIITMLLLVTPVFAGGPMDEPTDTESVTESETITEESSVAEETGSDTGIYTIRIDLGEQWASAKFYLDTDSGRTEYIADLLGGVSFKATAASESYTLSPKIQAPPSNNQEMEETNSTVEGSDSIDSTEIVEVIDGSLLESSNQSQMIEEESETDSSEILSEETQEESSEVVSQNNTANTISPISKTNEILNIVIIILGVVAIGAILGLVISRIISSVKQNKEKKKESAEEKDVDGEEEAQEENAEEDEEDELEDEEDEI